MPLDHIHAVFSRQAQAHRAKIAHLSDRVAQLTIERDETLELLRQEQDALNKLYNSSVMCNN